MEEWLKENYIIVFGGILGFFLALLFFTVGFFKTILLILLTIAGVGIGIYVKKSRLLDEFK